MNPVLPRRSFLSGLVTLPLIGGGVTLIGRPAAPVPLIRAVAMPTLQTPHERARYAWEAFSAAMRDITAGSSGWYAQGGQRVATVGYMVASEAPWMRAFHIDCVPMSDPRLAERGGLIERHREIEL